MIEKHGDLPLFTEEAVNRRGIGVFEVKHRPFGDDTNPINEPGVTWLSEEAISLTVFLDRSYVFVRDTRAAI